MISRWTWLVLALAAPLGAQQARPITLGEAIARGRSNGVQAALARLSAEGVDARQRGARGALLPDVTVSGTASRQTVNLREFGFSIPNTPAVTDPFTLFRGKLGVTQLLFDKATFERLRNARDTAEVAGLDAQRVGDLAAATAGVAWLRLASAQETVTARQDDSVTAVALLDIARSQVDAGTAARIERTRNETSVAARRSALALARNERDRAELDLARALDVPPGTALTASGDPTIVLTDLPQTAEAAVTAAKSHRVDLGAERARAKVIENGLRVIRSEFLPSLGASGFVQSSGTALGDLSGTWSIGVGLNWALFDGFRRSRRIDDQRLKIGAEQLRLRDLEAQVDADARLAMLDLASAREQVTLATDRVRLAEQEVAEARERFAAGVAGSVETTNAQAELTSARDALIQARVAAGAAQVGAARALGLLNQIH